MVKRCRTNVESTATCGSTSRNIERSNNLVRTTSNIEATGRDDGRSTGIDLSFHVVKTPGEKRSKDDVAIASKSLRKSCNYECTHETKLLPSHAVTPGVIPVTAVTTEIRPISNANNLETVSSTPTPLTCPKAIADLLWSEANYCCFETRQGEQSSSLSSTTITKKRTNYISWDDYFMAVATLSAQRSKDPCHPTGACIVDPSNRIIGIGYNGFPANCSDDVLPWGNGTSATTTTPTAAAEAAHVATAAPWLHTPTPYVVHAELNAILNKCSPDCNGARMYVQHFPCHDCAKVIIQSRIVEVVYVVPPPQQQQENDRSDSNSSSLNINNQSGKTNDCNVHDSDSFRASRILLTMANVRMRQYTPNYQRLDLNFDDALEHNVITERRKLKTETTANHNCTQGRLESGTSKTLQERNIYSDLLWKEAKYNIDLSSHPSSSSKRNDYLSWDDYFMSMAFLTAQRSKDPNTQVGACIVDRNQRIVGLGYNGFPSGCSDDYLPWSRGDADPTTLELHKKYMYVCHAEVNAILNKGSADVRGGTLYVALFPCNDCSKVIIQAGIREVVYMSDRYYNTDSCKASRILFQMAGIALRNYIPSVTSITIELNKDGIGLT